MKKIVMASVAAAALAGSAFAWAAVAAPADPASPPGQAGDAAEAGGFMLDARLAGMKAALKLNAEQEKNWAPFENAVREGAKSRMEDIRAMREAERGKQRPTPIENINLMADHLAKASSTLKSIAGAAKPLYDSLDETQKRHFGPLMMMLVEPGPHPGRRMGPMAGMGRMGGGMRPMGGMGMGGGAMGGGQEPSGEQQPEPQQPQQQK